NFADVTSSDPCLLTTAEVTKAFGSPAASPHRYQKYGECRYPLPALGLEVGINVSRLLVDPATYSASIRQSAGDAKHPVVDLPGLGDRAFYRAGEPIAGADVGLSDIALFRGRLYMYVLLELPLPIPKGAHIDVLTDPATQQRLTDLATAALARAPHL